MNAKHAMMIRKYALLRAGKEPGLNEKTLKKAFRMANFETRKVYIREMLDYFKAIEDKVIEPGESILYSVVSRNKE